MKRELQYREFIKAKNTADVRLGLGYNFPFGLSIEAVWMQSLSEILETAPNDYKLADSRNISQQISLNLGWYISKYGFDSRHNNHKRRR